MRLLTIIGCCIALAACSTTPKDLEQKTQPVIKSYAENYQEIYRRLSTTAKRCLAGNMSAYSSMAVDAQLYPDLGFGEVTVSLIDMGIRNYYFSAKVEKVDTGARLTVHSGNSLGATRLSDQSLRWADGDEECPLF